MRRIDPPVALHCAATCVRYASRVVGLCCEYGVLLGVRNDAKGVCPACASSSPVVRKTHTCGLARRALHSWGARAPSQEIYASFGGTMYYYGHFYRLDGYCCRSTLEIVSCEIDEPNDWLRCQADIVVVMMNPGSSRPENGADGPTLAPVQVGREAQLTHTCPDPTQTPIEELMRCRGFRHVRVLNLSDVRKPGNFPKLVASGSLPMGHSIFCEERQAELDKRLNARSEVVVVGWGYDKHLMQLADAAYGALVSRERKVHGWQMRPGFAHPYPRGQRANSRKWLDGVVETWPD